MVVKLRAQLSAASEGLTFGFVVAVSRGERIVGGNIEGHADAARRNSLLGVTTPGFLGRRQKRYRQTPPLWV